MYSLLIEHVYLISVLCDLCVGNLTIGSVAKANDEVPGRKVPGLFELCRLFDGLFFMCM